MRNLHPSNIILLIGYPLFAAFLAWKLQWGKVPVELLSVSILAVVTGVAANPTVPYRNIRSALISGGVMVAGVLVLFFWFKSGTKTLEPSKPAKVPAAAVWAGGPDGGAFIDCRPASEVHEYDCRVYNDRTGDLWDSGRYRLTSASPTFDPRKAESYDGFDGERILLRDHGTLEKVPKSSR